MIKLAKLTIQGYYSNSKASERYAAVIFEYNDGEEWNGWIPTIYRRGGLELEDNEEVDAYLKSIAIYCHSSMKEKWLKEQDVFWSSKSRSTVTRPIFDKLKELNWTCTHCAFHNPNIARRYQDLKDFGYTISTNLNNPCMVCDRNRSTHLLLVPIPRGGITGYETWSPELRKRIFRVLKNYDAYEDRQGKPEGLLPDHKFPEIRWDETTKRLSLDSLTEHEIRRDFQLMSNQRNQQKRESCRACYQNNLRGYPFGIKFYYKGEGQWPPSIPRQGKDAERGCVGCGWYDLQAWRNALNELINGV